MVYSLWMWCEKLTEKKKQLDKFRPLPDALIRNLDDWFRVELTYTSNAIEGNTLTRRETALVVEKGLTVGGKSLIEHLEATNHARALDWVTEQIKRKPTTLTEKDILHIHEVVLKGIDDGNAGHYRSVPVRISGSTVVLPNPRKVPDLMAEFIQWLSAAKLHPAESVGAKPHSVESAGAKLHPVESVGAKPHPAESVGAELHPVELAAEAHYRLVTIHPFVDGNGRTARLLMNMILLMTGYPAAIIRKRDRLAYISALEKAQLDGPKDDYLKIITKAVDRSLDIYLKAATGENAEPPENDKLLKIGELAKQVKERNSTIRYWTKEGLLTVNEVTETGYQLYAPEMVERVKQIHELKEQRLTLKEIKSKFG